MVRGFIMGFFLLHCYDSSNVRRSLFRFWVFQNSYFKFSCSRSSIQHGCFEAMCVLVGIKRVTSPSIADLLFLG